MVMRTRCRCKKRANVTLTAATAVNDHPSRDFDDEPRFNLEFKRAIRTAFRVGISETTGAAQSFETDSSRSRNERASHDATVDGDAPALVPRPRRQSLARIRRERGR